MNVKRMLFWVPAILAVALFAFAWDIWRSIGGAAEEARLERMRNSPQYVGDGFVNPLRVRSGDMDGAMRDFFFGDKALRIPSQPLPVVARTPEEFTAVSPELRITWFGHSALLVELDGRRILTDPMWGGRASPSSLMGPKRFFEPPLGLDELPLLDAVVFSHDHYDHLDRRSVRRLKERVPLFIAPLGLGAHLAGWGVPESKIVELDWWDAYDLGGVRLVCMPARHFSGRFLHDRNAKLWSGWAFIGDEQRVFFSGDSGMFPELADIGRRFGPFDATLLDVGAYNMAWPDVHMGPEQAVEAHKLLRGNVLVPIHWGTFNLSIHSWTAPMERLLMAAEKGEVRVVTPRPGASVLPRSPEPVDRWWPELPYMDANEFPIVSSQLD